MMHASLREGLNGQAVPSVLAALALVSVVVCSCTTRGTTPDNLGPDRHRTRFAFREGQRIYQHYCSPCHGDDGKGFGRYYVSAAGRRLPDFTAWPAEDGSGEALSVEALKEDRTNCLPWGQSFNDTEFEYVVGYIRSFPEDATREGAAGAAGAVPR
jgi:mono/diheme cytochrome c family protein